MARLTQHPSWKTLCKHQETMSALHMRSLFEADPNRFDKFSLNLDDLLLDYSKHRITEETLGLLFQIANEAKVEAWRDRMFAGEKLISQKIERYYIQPYVTAAIRLFMSTVMMSCLK